MFDGNDDGECDGFEDVDGFIDGARLIVGETLNEGVALGPGDGSLVGDAVGEVVGESVGERVGLSVELIVGCSVGDGVGVHVSRHSRQLLPNSVESLNSRAPRKKLSCAQLSSETAQCTNSLCSVTQAPTKVLSHEHSRGAVSDSNAP